MSRIGTMLRDPGARPRIILWSGVAIIAMVIAWAGSLIGTSTAWFCTTPCHIVHDDNTLAYEASSHEKISCIACHEPLNADPALFTYMKIFVLPDLPATIFGTFELPMNEFSYVAVEMPSEQCMQCHNLENREVTSSDAVLMNHFVHEQNDVTCPTCHNRVAHPEEDVELVLEGDRKHENWMTMDACFRCHGLERDSNAPGTCSACHPPDLDLEPPSHDAADWYAAYGESSGHAAAAVEESAAVEHAQELAGEREGVEHAEGPLLEPAGTVNSCYTCHRRLFCAECHGIAMPHPAGFAEDHAAAGLSRPATCARCHARSAAEAKGTQFCTSCHHPQSKPGSAWVEQHFETVKSDGAAQCFECHEETYCSACHLRGPDAARELLYGGE